MQIPPSLVNEHFDDRYFDVVNALDEAQQIFFVNNDLPRRIAASTEAGEPFVIGEIGFGVGRIVVALMEFLGRSGLRNVQIEYNSVELYPLSPERMLAILDGFRPRAAEEIDALLAAYRAVNIEAAGWQRMQIERPFGVLHLHLWLGEALEMVQALDQPCDVWFLDGHGPKKNPSMWRPELLLAVGEKTKSGGACSTFTVASVVRKGLIAAGFTLKRYPGCGGKKEVLQGLKP
jgi:tRNA 5-methylaminomethyl-2-thiouridine biosynthesis bifunctional protein